MFDIFIKFSDYSLPVRVLVASWIVFTAIVGLVSIFARPLKKEPAQIQVEKPQQKNTPPSPSKIKKEQQPIINAPNSVISIDQKGGITAGTINNITVNSSNRPIPDNISGDLMNELSQYKHKRVSIRIANNEMQGNEPIKTAEKLRDIFIASGWDVSLSNSHNMIANGVVTTGITIDSVGASNTVIADFICDKLRSTGLAISCKSYGAASEKYDLFINVWTK